MFRSVTAMVAALLLHGLGAAQPVSAQRIGGRLLDVVSDDPIAAGILTLRTPEGVPITVAVADKNGTWVLEAPQPGSYYIEATRMGYQPWTAGPLTLGAGDDLRAVYHLRRQPVQLAPIEVSVAAMKRHLELVGFYERQRSEPGYFMTSEDIQKRRTTRVTDLLLGLPGVSVVTGGGGSVGPRQIQLRGSNLSQGEVCRPRVFVDGLIYARGDSRPRRRTNRVDVEQRLEEELQRIDQALSLDDIGPPSDLLAVEVYRSATQVPVQFGGTSVETLCGVIVVWTRMGTARIRR